MAVAGPRRHRRVGVRPADGTHRAETYAVFDEAVVRNTARIEAALAEGGLDLVAHVDDGNGNHPRLRRLLVDLLEEYGRHTGHADLLREAVDGRVGEDPGEDWVPTGWADRC